MLKLSQAARGDTELFPRFWGCWICAKILDFPRQFLAEYPASASTSQMWWILGDGIDKKTQICSYWHGTGGKIRIKNSERSPRKQFKFKRKRNACSGWCETLL